MNISTLKTPYNSKKIAFGSKGTPQRIKEIVRGGETYVITSHNLYFQEFTPENILKSKTIQNTSQAKRNKMRRYFLPFRRINQISNNTNNIRYAGGCQIITAVSEKMFETLKKLTQLEPRKRANIWLPSILGIKSTGELKIHGKNNLYQNLANKFDKSRNPLEAITEMLISNICNKRTQDLIIAVGNKEEDLDYVDPFKRLNINPNNKGSFDAIKDLPFRSAFIINKRTPERLKEKLKQIAQHCNADGYLRFAIINQDEKTLTNKISHAILLLQKAFANYNTGFRNNISEELRTVLSYQRLEYNNMDLKPKWVQEKKPINTTLFNRIRKFLLHNKCSTALIFSAIAIPLYFKNFYKEKHSS